MYTQTNIDIDTTTDEGKKAYMKEYRKLNKERTRELGRSKQNERRRENKIRAINYLGGECDRCKLQSKHYSIYDFHHKDPSEKEADPGSLMHLKWDTIFKEISKCVLLCANCHRIVHELENE